MVSLQETGHTVHLAGRESAELTEVAARLGCDYSTLDPLSFEEVRSLLTEVSKKYGRLDGAICCLGSIVLKPAHLTSQAEWEHTMAVNVTSAFGLVAAAGRVMRRDGGSVVLMSSAAARHGLANHEAIGAAKAAVIGLMRSAASTYSSAKIRFNAVAPGLVDTPMAADLTSKPAVLKASESMHALGRIGTPDDLAPLIAWLLERRSGWVTGQVFGVDGGLATVRGR
jgi:NAD(P)-dependent dehydrogenase (short-subunit alcohol dehydrogenase family)